MEKTSVYLSERERKRLGELAEDTGMSQAEIIREAIAQYMPERFKTPRYFASFGVGEGPGDSVADIPDEELFKGFGEQ